MYTMRGGKSDTGGPEKQLILLVWPNYVMRMSRKHNGHALCIEYMQALSIGVVTLANKKALFMTPVDRIHRFHAL